MMTIKHIQALLNDYKSRAGAETVVLINEAIKSLDSVRENVRGEWIDCEVVHDRKDAKITDWQQARCSICGKWHTTPYMYSWYHFDYCPNCGEKMRGDKT